MDTGKYDMLDSMLKRKKPTQELTDELLQNAVLNGDLRLVRQFLALGANPNYKSKIDGKTALMHASDGQFNDRYREPKKPYVEIIQLLKQRGATQ
jgi:ankyrin repeat protein